MKSAIEVMAKVQMVRVRGFMLPSFLCDVVTDHSYLIEKREGSYACASSRQPSASLTVHNPWDTSPAE
jgi:hypothetical protein